MQILHVTYTVNNGTAKEFLEALKECGIVSGSRAEKGNIKYDYYFPEDAEIDNVLFLVEKWQSEEIFNEHIQTDHFKAANSVKLKFDATTSIERFNANEV